MSQSLKCPSCNAPLEIEDEFASLVECDFCGVSSKMNAFASGADAAGGGGQVFQMHFGGTDLLAQARKLKEIKQLALSGHKLNAIKLYREVFGGGLAEAKDAVENIAEGKPVVFANVQTFSSGHGAFGFGDGGAGGDLGETLDQAFQLAKIKAELQRGGKINAVQMYRDAFGGGLYEAKQAVDAIERGENVRLPKGGGQIKSTFGSDSPKTIYVGGRNAGSFVTRLVIGFIVLGLLVFGLIWLITSLIERSGGNVRAPFSNGAPAPPPNQPAAETPRFAAEVWKFGGEGTGAGLFKDNRTVAVDTEGRIFSADFSGGRVQVFDAQGKFQTQIMADTTKTVDALETDRRGNLYVLQGYDLHRFEVKNPENHSKTRIDTASDVAVGLDGKVYVGTRRNGISVVSPEGKILQTISTANTGLQDIRLLAIDGAGNFYAVDGISFSVFKLSPTGQFLTRFGGRSSATGDKPPPGLFRSSPDDIAVDPRGRVYVSQVSKISVFDADGAFIEDFKTTQAFGMAFNDRGELFAATRPFVTKYEIKQ